MKKIRIAIADDHPLILSGLQHVLSLEEDMEVIGCYPDGESLLGSFAAQQPDVLLLDIHMPGQTGDELARMIVRSHPGIHVLMLTNQDNVYYIKNLLQHGILGYVLKTAPAEVLTEAIRQVSMGLQFLEPALKEKVLQHTLSARQHRPQGPALTRREKEVLKLIASNYSSQEIADQLFISKRTVDNHRIGLLLKLGVKNSAGLVKKAMDQGLLD